MNQPPKTDLARDLWEMCPICYGELVSDQDTELYCPKGHYKADTTTTALIGLKTGQEIVADGGPPRQEGDDE